MAIQAELAIKDRLAIGKADELEQVKVLIKNGFKIEDTSTIREDTIDKIDRYIVFPDGKRSPLQIKGRDRSPEKSHIYRDFLRSKKEPYLGISHRLTQDARDSSNVCQCEYFSERIQNDLYLVNSIVYNQIEETVFQEWCDSSERVYVDRMLNWWASNKLPQGKFQAHEMFSSFGTMYSEQYPGNGSTEYRAVQVRCTQDRRNFRPKLLIFTPPTTFSKKDIQKFSML